ncbi:hypothetical protein HDV00_006091 [Rhizophlyctis rosea]|nr:hypothetical protein HDV00_006091 [Rhizophlyctis rosea]
MRLNSGDGAGQDDVDTWSEVDDDIVDVLPPPSTASDSSGCNTTSTFTPSRCKTLPNTPSDDEHDNSENVPLNAQRTTQPSLPKPTSRPHRPPKTERPLAQQHAINTLKRKRKSSKINKENRKILKVSSSCAGCGGGKPLATVKERLTADELLDMVDVEEVLGEGYLGNYHYVCAAAQMHLLDTNWRTEPTTLTWLSDLPCETGFFPVDTMQGSQDGENARVEDRGGIALPPA